MKTAYRSAGRTVLVIVALVCAGCGNDDPYKLKQFTYDSTWSGNIFRWDSPAFPVVTSVEVFSSNIDDGFEEPYEAVQKKQKILELDRSDQISDFMSALHADQNSLSDRDLVDMSARIDRSPHKIYHIVLWGLGRTKSAYGRLLVFKERDKEYAYLKAWDGAEHYILNIGLIPYLSKFRK